MKRFNWFLLTMLLIMVICIGLINAQTHFLGGGVLLETTDDECSEVCGDVGMGFDIELVELQEAPSIAVASLPMLSNFTAW